MNACDDYNVLLVDDHHMMRMGLMALAQSSSRLNIHWFEASNLSDAVCLYREHPRIDFVMLDLNLPDSQGLQGVQRFMGEFPQARLAVFSATEDAFVVNQAMALGATGFIPKSAAAVATLMSVESHLESVRPPMAQRQPLNMAKSIANFEAINQPSKTTQSTLTDALTPTQLKVLELVLAGMSNQEIATASKLALGTVKNTVSSTMLALDVRSRSHLISMFR